MCQNRLSMLPAFRFTWDSSSFQTFCRIKLRRVRFPILKKLYYWRVDFICSSAAIIRKLLSALKKETSETVLELSPVICGKIITLKWLSGKIYIFPGLHIVHFYSNANIVERNGISFPNKSFVIVTNNPRGTVLAKNIRHLSFFILEFFYMYYFLLITGIIHKFKEFLKQRIIHSK